MILQNRDSQDDNEILTDNDGSELQSDAEKSNSDVNKLEASTSENENTENRSENKTEKTIEIDSKDTESNLQVDLESQSNNDGQAEMVVTTPSKCSTHKLSYYINIF